MVANRTALVLGGTGLIGRAAVPALAAAGFDVTVAHRGQRPATDDVVAHARPVTLDREDDTAVRRALGDGVDVLVDIVCMTPAHARQLAALDGLAGSLVVISSAAVYVDDDGVGLLSEDPVASPPVPVIESQRTVEPDAESYAGRKVAIEQALAAAGPPATLLRAGAIYGPGDTAAREWFFVQRMLDGRRVLPLAFRGESRFHQAASANVAELIRRAAEQPGRRVLNAADPEAWTVLQTAEAVGRLLDHPWETVLIDGPPPRGEVGGSPWAVPAPVVLSMDAARAELGYEGSVTHEAWLERTCAWLLEATRERDWRDVLPRAGQIYADLFDYDAEDAWLRER